MAKFHYQIAGWETPENRKSFVFEAKDEGEAEEKALRRRMAEMGQSRSVAEVWFGFHDTLDRV